jgi:hypothetical protein
MKKLQLSITASLLLLTSNAQEKKLLQQFKYRIQQYKALSFNSNANSSYNQANFNTASAKNNTTSSGLNTVVTYATIQSTDKILLTTSSSFYGGYGRVKANDSANENTSNSFTIQPQVNILNKWFTNNKFIELGTQLNGNYYYLHEKNNSANYKSNQGQYNITIIVGIGKGRLENITNMQNALWLNKALTKALCLTKQLTEDQLLALGQTITTANNTRVLDNRKRIQFILKTTDNFLQQNTLINKTDINYFSHLNDILFFAINNTRQAGTEKFIRLNPSLSSYDYSYTQNNLINKFSTTNTVGAAVIQAGIQKYTPVNLQHQNNYGIKALLTYASAKTINKQFNNQNLTSNIQNSSTLSKAAIQSFYQHTYYPNSRTDISFTATGEIGYQQAANNKSLFGIATAAFDLNYFISYNTRFTATAGINYQNNNYNVLLYNIVQQNNYLQLFTKAGIEVNF